jgi:hypothetical protein
MRRPLPNIDFDPFQTVTGGVLDEMIVSPIHALADMRMSVNLWWGAERTMDVCMAREKKEDEFVPDEADCEDRLRVLVDAEVG